MFEPAVISSFTDVLFPINSLILCDIDDTVLRYNGLDSVWWQSRKGYHYSITSDKYKAEELAIEEWTQLIKHTVEPIATDYIGLHDMIERVKQTDSTLYFITARDSGLQDLTHNHLLHLGIVDPIVHYCGGRSKGLYLKDIDIDLSQYTEVHFIDDYKHNLEQMYIHFKDQIKYYKFVYKL